MLDVKDFGPKDPIYIYVDNDGTNVGISSRHLREHCIKTQYEQVLTPVRLDLANKMLRDNVVDMKRVLALTPKHLRDPIIYCKDLTSTNGAPDVFLVDGHHRFVRAALEGRQLILAWLLDYKVWQPFRVGGLPQITQDQLRAHPHLKRNY